MYGWGLYKRDNLETERIPWMNKVRDQNDIAANQGMSKPESITKE